MRTLRAELFDHVVPRDEDHLRELLAEYLQHYHRRPRRLGQKTPAQAQDGLPFPEKFDPAKLVVRPVLNGLIQEYERRSA